MDLRNKNTRKILLQLLDKQFKTIISDNHSKTIFQDQLIRFQGDQNLKQTKQRQYSPSPKIMRTQSQSEHITFYERQQSQLKLKNQRLQQSKEKLISKKLEQENQENTFHPKILKSKNINSQVKHDIYKSGIKWLQQKADHIDKLKESSTIYINQENSFKPTLNKTSQKIIQQCNQQDFFQRMNTSENRKQLKMKKLRNDATPSFKPQINNHLKKGQNNQNKDILQVSVNLELLEKVRDYHQRDNSKSNLNLSYTDYRNRDCTSALSQTIQIDNQNSQSPSFRNSTIKKQSLLQIDFNSPNNNFTEMLYEALGDSQYDCF